MRPLAVAPPALASLATQETRLPVSAIANSSLITEFPRMHHSFGCAAANYLARSPAAAKPDAKRCSSFATRSRGVSSLTSSSAVRMRRIYFRWSNLCAVQKYAAAKRCPSTTSFRFSRAQSSAARQFSNSIRPRENHVCSGVVAQTRMERSADSRQARAWRRATRSYWPRAISLSFA